MENMIKVYERNGSNITVYISKEMMGTFEKQMQLLSERSAECTPAELPALSASMIEIFKCLSQIDY